MTDITCLADVYLFFYLYLSDDAFSVTRTTQRRMKGWQVNDEFKRMLKEVVVA
jgi:hypothetical protein